MSARPGFTFLICPDPEMIKRRLERLMREAGGGFEKQVFWGDADEFDPAYWQALSSVSLFATPKVVLLRRAENMDAAFWEKLARPLSGFNEYAWPVVCLEGPHDPKKGHSLPKGLDKQPYWKVAQARQWVWVSPGLTGDTIMPLLRDWAGARSLTFAPGVAQELAQALPRDMTAAARELDKLELAARDGVLSKDLVELIRSDPELEIFNFLKALEEGRDAAGVWRTVFGHQLASEDGFLFQFLAVLAREARLLWQLAHEDPDVKVHPYVRKLKSPLAGRMGRRGLARIWDLAMEAETSVKSGRKSPEQALEILVADLHVLFSGARGGA